MSDGSVKTMSSVIMVSLFVIFCATQSYSARILAVFPWPSISHQVVYRPLTHELVRIGHEVTVITADPAFPKGQAPINLTEIDVHNISYGTWKQAMVKSIKGSNDFLSKLKYISSVLNEIMESQFRSIEVQNLLNETREFDLIIAAGTIDSVLIFSHFFKAPVIQIVSHGTLLGNKNALGIPKHPLLYPTMFGQKVYNPTTWDKVTEFYNFCRLEWHFSVVNVKDEDAMLKKVFGPDVPSVRDLYNNIDMFFLNVHPIWENNVPVPPNVVHIWGMHKKEERVLPEDIKSYLDSSVHGVIYMSFGSNTVPSMLPSEKIQAFVKVFSELPYDILWKWDKDELPGRTDNIRIGKWFPQVDILRHPKVKLFIMQGGLQSTEEAINSGVPLIGVPMFSDQWYNVDRYRQFKIGTKLDIETLTEKDVRNAIQTVLTDDSYRQNIIKLRSIMRDEPESALDRAVWWTEYVLRHKGAKHLRAAGANLSWSEYYEIPLISTVFLSLTVATLAVFCIVWSVLKCFLTSKNKIKVQ